MKLVGPPSVLIREIPYLNAASRGGPPVTGLLEILTVKVMGLGELAGLIVTGDLQFRERRGTNDRRPARLIGEVLAEDLASLSEVGALPPADKMGVVLTGDLFCEESLQSRGGLGDVRSVWEAFAERFAFVAGVAGNHDGFGTEKEEAEFRTSAGRHLLDIDTVELGGLLIGGVGGIIGDPVRPNRRTEGEYLAAVNLLLGDPLDLLALHESPAIAEQSLRGSQLLREVLEVDHPALVACGHTYWARPLASLSSGTCVINVDSRCVVLIERNSS